MSDPEIETIGFSSKSLSAEQKGLLDKIYNAQKGKGLLGIQVFKNFNVPAEDNLMPTGLQLIFKKNAKVDASILPDNLFETVASVAVSGVPEVKDTKVLASSVLQDPPVNLRLTNDVRHPLKNTDTRHWVNELGGVGSFVGLYQKINPEDPREKNFFLVARGAPVQYIKDLKSFIRQNPNLTYDALIQDEQLLKFGELGARRNIARNLLRAAQALGTEIPFQSDPFAKTSDQAFAAPEMAVPDWQSMTNSITSGWFKNQEAVFIHYGVIPASESAGREDHPIIGSPYDGIYVFPLTNVTLTHEAGAVPADTGRKTKTQDLIGKPIPQERLESVVYESKDINTELHPDAFFTVDEPFKAAMEDYGWERKNGLSRMIPIAVKIYSK